MPLSLSSIAIEEKNKLSTDSVFLVCLKITIPGLANPVYLVGDRKDFPWKGITWQAFPFQINEITDSTSEVPQIDILVSNVSRQMDVYLAQYDTYIKANGFSPVTVNIYVVNTRVVTANSNAEPEVEHLFELKKPKADSKWATFTLGAANPYNQRFPRNKILKNFCRYKFKDSRCGYTGIATTCNHTLANCRAIEGNDGMTAVSELGNIVKGGGKAFILDTERNWVRTGIGYHYMELTDSAGYKFAVYIPPADDFPDSAYDNVLLVSVQYIYDQPITILPTQGAYTISNSYHFGGAPGVGVGGFETS